MTCISGNGENIYLQWLQSYESFGQASSYGVVLDPVNDPTVENLFATDMYKDYCLRCFHWTQEGVQPGDPTDTNMAQDYFGAQQLFTICMSLNPEQKVMAGSNAARNGFEVGYAHLVEAMITNSTITEYMWGGINEDMQNSMAASLTLRNIMTLGLYSKEELLNNIEKLNRL